MPGDRRSFASSPGWPGWPETSRKANLVVEQGVNIFYSTNTYINLNNLRCFFGRHCGWLAWLTADCLPTTGLVTPKASVDFFSIHRARRQKRKILFSSRPKTDLEHVMDNIMVVLIAMSDLLLSLVHGTFTALLVSRGSPRHSEAEVIHMIIAWSLRHVTLGLLSIRQHRGRSLSRFNIYQVSLSRGCFGRTRADPGEGKSVERFADGFVRKKLAPDLKQRGENDVIKQQQQKAK
jgi:hypothetical protein